MAPKLNPKCMECQTTESVWWSTLEAGNQICHACYGKKNEQIKTENIIEDLKIKSEQEEVDTKINEERKLRKSTRSTRYKYKSQTIAQQSTPTGSADNTNSVNTAHSNHATSGNNGNSTSVGSSKSQSKSRSRRHIFKKAPAKLILQPTAETHSVESVFYKNTYMQVGDIVSLMDHENNLYYAQIRGLLVDAYSEKSAYLTWLLPTTCSPDPKEGFDPSTYLIGPDEQFSRKLSCLEFVMHAPSNYFHDRTTPFPLPDSATCSSKPGGYVWTRLNETKIHKVSTR